MAASHMLTAHFDPACGSLMYSRILKTSDILKVEWSSPCSNAQSEYLMTSESHALYKNKGDRSDCNSYRGISLLTAPGKVFARILLNRLLPLSEPILPETQFGYRPNRSTCEAIFSIRQLQEKSREQGQPLYACFVDLEKAFDSVPREALWVVLAKLGCTDIPP